MYLKVHLKGINMKILDIELDVNKLTKNEVKVADYVIKNLSNIVFISTEEIAKDLNISTATVSRFWKSIGFDNFKAFKNHVKESVNIGSPAGKMKDIIEHVDDKDIIDEMIQRALINMNKTTKSLDRESLNDAVEKLAGAKTLYVFASGAAEALSNLLYFRLNRFGIRVKILPSSGHSLFENLINMNSDDVVIVFGFSNVIPEQKVILDHSKKIGYSTILITDLYFSELIHMSDVVLHVERGEIWEFHSMVTPLLLVEALVVGIALKNEDESMDKLDYLHELRNLYKKYLPR